VNATVATTTATYTLSPAQCRTEYMHAWKCYIGMCTRVWGPGHVQTASAPNRC
jgi:hypothetical protein